jgi:hypothetical protein
MVDFRFWGGRLCRTIRAPVGQAARLFGAKSNPRQNRKTVRGPRPLPADERELIPTGLTQARSRLLAEQLRLGLVRERRAHIRRGFQR